MFFCFEILVIEIKVFKLNVWGFLVDVEVVFVVEWFFVQVDFNLIVMEEVGGWDNIM